MSDNILYNFGANHDHIGAIQTGLNNTAAAKEEISKMFAVLHTVYEGEGQTALLAAHQNAHAQLDEALQNSHNSQRNATDQQELMQALDQRNAAQF